MHKSRNGGAVQLVFINPSTNHRPNSIHMNTCNHSTTHGRLGHPNGAYYNIMRVHNMTGGVDGDSLGNFSEK
jgi:hypothetical protein